MLKIRSTYGTDSNPNAILFWLRSRRRALSESHKSLAEPQEPFVRGVADRRLIIVFVAVIGLFMEACPFAESVKVLIIIINIILQFVKESIILMLITIIIYY